MNGHCESNDPTDERPTQEKVYDDYNGFVFLPIVEKDEKGRQEVESQEYGNGFGHTSKGLMGKFFDSLADCFDSLRHFGIRVLFFDDSLHYVEFVEQRFRVGRRPYPRFKDCFHKAEISI